MAKYSKTERAEALENLRKWLKPGDTVYTILDHVSRSGMTRHIRLLVNIKGDEGARRDFIHPNRAAAIVLGESQAKRDGLIVTGCGMDMGFATVYNLSRYLFPDGFGVEGISDIDGAKVRPESKQDAAAMVANGYKFRGRNGDASGWDDDGGYALSHSWL